MRKLIGYIGFVFIIASPLAFAEIDLKELHLPQGFSISIYAKVPNARQMTLGDNSRTWLLES